MKKIVGCLLGLCIFLATWVPLRPQAVQQGIPVGGIHILMTGLTGEPLPGAEFLILRDAKDQELGDHRVEKKMVRIEEQHRIMSVESFWCSKEMTGEKSDKLRTDSDGKACVYGLGYGTYYLLETKAPEGHNRMVDPIRITVHKYSHLTQEDGICDEDGKIIDNTLHIVNLRYTLPETAGWGTLQLAAAGTGVVFSSAALYLLGRKRR